MMISFPHLQIAVVSFLCDWFDTQSFISPLYSSESSTDMPSLDHDGTAGSVKCCIVGTTNRPEDVDLRLRRSGRLEKEIEVACAREDRVRLLKTMLLQALSPLLSPSYAGNTVLLKSHEISSSHSETSRGDQMIEDIVESVVDRLGGYVAADISSLVRETCMILSQRIIEDSLHSPTKTNPAVHKGIESSSSFKHLIPQNVPNVGGAFHDSLEPRVRASLEKALTIVSPSALRGVSIKVSSVNNR